MFSYVIPAKPIVIKARLRRRVNRMPFKQTDGGKNESGFLHEVRDCTVRSLALAAGISYADAHKCCADAGRRPRQGLTDIGVRKSADIAAAKFGLKIFEVPRPALVASQYVSLTGFTTEHGIFARMREKYNHGRYIFTSGRHAFAVIDGVLHDAWHVGGRTRVGMIIKIDKAEQITQPQINELWDRLNKLEGV